MPDYDLHRPSFTGTTTNDWEFPTEQDFEVDDLSRIAEHFLLSASGFDDPDGFDDLQLPVVNAQGYLSLNGLWAARRGPYSVERIDDINAETKANVRDLIDDLGTENFETYRDVTVTDAEWEAATGGANAATSIVNDRIDPAEPSYSPESAVVGLAFLVCGSAALARANG